MVSDEFKAAVANHNLLLVRIMMKDALILDVTFNCFNEMYDYVEKFLPEIFETYDKGYLEDDPDKWDDDVMNLELTELVTNFSKVRIEHLKEVIGKVFLPKRKAMTSKDTTPMKENHVSPQTVNSDQLRRDALRTIMSAGKEIAGIINQIQESGECNLLKVRKLETSAENLLKATRIYEANANRR